MNIFQRFIEAIKGDVHIREILMSVETVEGIIPPSGRYGEEKFRFQVWIHRISKTRDCWWIPSEDTFRYSVRPMTIHMLPLELRGRTILSQEPAPEKDMQAVDTNTAATAYRNWIMAKRSEFERLNAEAA